MGSKSRSTINTNTMDEEGKPIRRLITVRHGERMDLAFGEWVKSCFDKQGKYKPQDLNHPRKVIDRTPRSYLYDSPLTSIGEFQGFLFGQALGDHKMEINHVYCSPALRCLQTCHNILKGSGLEETLTVNIEPGLFEYLGDHVNRLPTWLTPKEAAAGTGMNINLDYVPLINSQDLLNLHAHESISDYYSRCYSIVSPIISSTCTGNILIVAHASSLDSCTRLLTGKTLPNWNQFNNHVSRIPYLAHSNCQLTKSGKWEMIKPTFPGITISYNQRYDYLSAWSVLPQ